MEAVPFLMELSPERHACRKVLEAVIRIVADEFGLTVSEMMMPSRSHAVWKPRMAAMYLARLMTDCSLPELGRAFGGRSHTTVLRATRRCRDLMDRDVCWRECLAVLRNRLERHAADMVLTART